MFVFLQSFGTIRLLKLMTFSCREIVLINMSSSKDRKGGSDKILSYLLFSKHDASLRYFHAVFMDSSELVCSGVNKHHIKMAP